MRSLRHLKIVSDQKRREVALLQERQASLEEIVRRGSDLTAMLNNKVGRAALLATHQERILECDIALDNYLNLTGEQRNALLERKATIKTMLEDLKKIPELTERAKNSLDAVKSKIKIILSNER